MIGQSRKKLQHAYTNPSAEHRINICRGHNVTGIEVKKQNRKYLINIESLNVHNLLCKCTAANRDWNVLEDIL